MMDMGRISVISSKRFSLIGVPFNWHYIKPLLDEDELANKEKLYKGFIHEIFIVFNLHMTI